MEAEALFELAAKVAPHVGRGWRFNRVMSEAHEHAGGWGHQAILTNDNNRAERIRLNGNYYRAAGRIGVSGNYPPNSGSRKRVSISCDNSRDPRAIGRDIAARFLPLYRAELAEAIKDAATREGQEEALRQRLAVLASQCREFKSYPYSGSAAYHFETRRSAGRIKHYDSLDDVVDFDFRLTFYDAVRLLAWLNREDPAP